MYLYVSSSLEIRIRLYMLGNFVALNWHDWLELEVTHSSSNIVI